MNNLSPERSAPVYSYVLSWIVLAPLLYFCVHGALFWQHIGTNSALGSHLGEMAAGPSDSTLSRAQNIGIFILTMALAFTRLKSVALAATRYQVFIWLPVFAIVSALWSDDPAKSIYLGVFLLGNAIFAFYISERFQPYDWMLLIRFVGFFAIFGSIALCIFFPQYGIDLKQSETNWQGIWTHKNSCAIVTCYLLAPALFLRSYTLRDKFANGTYILAGIFLIAMSQSRTGWIVFLCLLLTKGSIELISRFAGRERYTMALLVASAAFIGIIALVFVMPVVLEAIGKDPTMTGRTQIWALVMVSIAQRPWIGYGYKAFWNGFQGAGASISFALGNLVANAQSGFLDTWLEIGIFGLLLTLYPFFSAFRASWRLILASSDSCTKFSVCVLMVTLVSNLDERSANYPNFLEWVMFIVACVWLRNAVKAVRSVPANVEVSALAA